MYNKRFYVKIVMKLHAITCPGVWLCTHGYLEVTIKTLGYYFRTGAMEPHFPLLCHDQFTMEGYFKSVGSMDELERVLAAEQVEITLWQNGRRLAYFLGKLAEVMHPCVPKLTCAHNINVQLLMKATPAFPGIIAPKVELTAQVGIQDLLSHSVDAANAGSAAGSSCSKYRPDSFVMPNFQLNSERRSNRHCHQQSEESTGCFDYLEERRRQKPVCHTKATCASGSSRYNSALPCPNSLKEFETDISHKNEQRRLSTCSSHFSSNSYNSIQTSRSSSGCCHTQPSITSGSAPGDHQQRCIICQSYREAFSHN